MPEIVDNKQIFTLREVAESIRRTLAQRYTSLFWVKAEMNKLNHYGHSGHCYPDLVQKEAGKVVAQMRAIIWAADFKRIESAMQRVTGETLREGSGLLLQVAIQFDPNHGLSLLIKDIDPVFSLGELEKEKNESIQRLMSQGVFHLNKQQPMPLLPKRLAVISVESSKGYADFMLLLGSSKKGYNIEHMLFPSLLQGQKAARQIENQLLRIKKVAHHFDAVAIIRGGGGEIGLAAFNDYQLAHTVCAFPIPVITGIGHATNLTVTEMVAHTNAITPSELAGIILARFDAFSQSLEEAGSALANAAKLLSVNKEYIKYQQLKLQSIATFQFQASQKLLLGEAGKLSQAAFAGLQHATRKLGETTLQQRFLVHEQLKKEKIKLDGFLLLMQRKPLTAVAENTSRLESLERMVGMLNPEKVLKRGYSISYHDGKVLFGTEQLSEGAVVSTKLGRGSFMSKVIKKENEN